MTVPKDEFHTAGTVSEYYSLDHTLFSSIFADAHKALDRSRNSSVCLWISRHRLALSPTVSKAFLERMETLEEIRPAIGQIGAYAIDSEGKAFLVIPTLDGSAVDATTKDRAELERRYIAIVNLVTRAHRAGIALGDITPNSFWIDRSGGVRCLGLLGVIWPEAPDEFDPPIALLPYLAPEQRSQRMTSLRSDVFGLGVLGYYLFTGTFPYGPKGVEVGGRTTPAATAIEALRRSAPAWAETVLTKCVAANPDQRFADADEMMNAIVEARKRTLAADSSPVRPDRGGSPNKRFQDGVVTQGAPIKSKQQAVVEDAPRRNSGDAERSNFALKVIFASLATAILVGMVFYLLHGPGANPTYLPETLAVHRSAVTDPGLKEAIDIIAESKISIQDKAKQIERLRDSSDPLAQDVLVRTALDPGSVELQKLAEHGLAERAERQGFARSAELLRFWLSTSARGTDLATREAVLKLFDTAMPLEARSSLLRQIYPGNEDLVLKMSAALAIDSGKPDDFQPLLAQLVGDSLDREDTQERSALALMLVSPAIGLVYSEEVMKRRAEIPDQDILWLLDRLAERNDLAVRPVAGLAAERNLVSPLRKLFLTTLRDRGDLIPDVVVALVRAAQGKLTKADMASFGRWFDNDAERVVLAAAADDYPQEIREEAFDVLAGKSLFSEPAATMLDWVRKDYWDRRADFVPLIGILSNVESADPARVNQVLAEMDQVLRDSNLIELLLSTKQAPVVRLLIQRYSDMLGLGVLLSLLDNESKEVRISAVKALKRFNDVGALRFIVEHYEHEEDPDVQQVYRETFEMIAEREARHGAAAGR